MAVASTFTDRLCIATNGYFTESLSAQNLMACGDSEQQGCNGGSAFRAWEFIANRGIVTGGNFGSKEVLYTNLHIRSSKLNIIQNM